MVAEPLNVPVKTISTIFVEEEKVDGVAAGEAGLVIGATVTAVGAVPPKLSLIAGSSFVLAIAATVPPLGILATLEFGVEPAETTATKGAFPEESNLEIKMSLPKADVRSAVPTPGSKSTLPLKYPVV